MNDDLYIDYASVGLGKNMRIKKVQSKEFIVREERAVSERGGGVKFLTFGFDSILNLLSVRNE